MNNIVNLKKHSLNELVSVAEYLVDIGEQMVLMAKTPSQAQKMNLKLDKMKLQLKDLTARRDRLENNKDLNNAQTQGPSLHVNK